MGTRYPLEKDRLSTQHATNADRDAAINALQDRVGALFDFDPGSVEDRLLVVENLLDDVIERLRPPKGLPNAGK